MQDAACVNLPPPARYEWRHNIEHAVQRRGGHVYQFGVYGGDSMRKLHKALQPEALWGFDSFRGLPETSQPNIKDWSAGAWVADPRKERWPVQVHWIQGWYNRLEDGLVGQRGMQPATYVDLDCDLYDSTVAALDFMLRNRLIVEGTVVGYDDWWVLPCGDAWANATVDAPLRSGEGRAHLELAERYAVDFRCVGGSCGCPRSPRKPAPSGLSWGALFRVESIGKRASSGYEGALVQPQMWNSRDCIGLRWGRNKRNCRFAPAGRCAEQSDSEHSRTRGRAVSGAANGTHQLS